LRSVFGPSASSSLSDSPNVPRRAASRTLVVLPLLLIVATLVAYQPIWHAGFIWDDDYHVTRNSTLHDLDGLWRIWFEVGAVPQYYPLVHTVFWVEYQLWGVQPMGYHVVNVVLHALAALLLARVLRRLRIPGAWLAAFIFALHPVGVESVAWVTELKNVLSAVFYLASALTYLRFTELRDAGMSNRRHWAWYATALVWFAAALLSKTVTCSLPAALLLMRWWQTGRVRAVDILPTVPFIILGAGLGLHTAFIESYHVHAQGPQWSLTLVQRCLVAGRAVWFYACKLIWPAHLTFIYPRWSVSPAVWWQWVFPFASLGVVLTLWLGRRRIGRGPLTGVLYFAGTLGPALGFVNVYPMRYSFVADHFQYLASIGLITLVAAGVSTRLGAFKTRRPFLELTLCGTVLCALGVLTWRQTWMYADVETLWRTTIARNPGCSMAYNNLGHLLLRRGQADEALVHFQKAIDSDPDNAEAHESLGTVLLKRGRVDEAMSQLQQAVAIQPAHSEPHYNLGNILLQKGRVDEAIAEFEKALDWQPDYLVAHNSLGVAYLRKGQAHQAAAHFQVAANLDPNAISIRSNLGAALLQDGRMDEAIAQFQRALKIRPGFAEAYGNLRYAAWVLATSPDVAVRNGRKAVELAQQANQFAGGQNPVFIATLAAAYAEAGQFPEAVAATQRALQLAVSQDNTALVHTLQTQLALHQSGRPYREAPGAAPQVPR